MSEHIPDSVESRASITGHPIHPMLIPLPIGFLIGVLLSDIGYATTTSPFWAEASRWLLLGGILTGAAAGIVGLIDFISIAYVRSQTAAWIHFVGNATVIALSIVNLLIRPSDPQADAPGGALIVSIVVVLMLFVTGWLGGELSYRYRVGVMARSQMSD